MCKKYAFILILGFLSQNLLAQSQLEHPKTTFQDENNRIFWQVSLPVYLNISPTPDGSKAYPMKNTRSEQMKKFSVPMYFDGHGVHYIRHLDYEHAISEQEVAFEINVDGLAPVCKANVESPNKLNFNGKTYYNSGVKISLSATDEMSGLDKIYYSLNSAAYQAYSETLSLEQEKDYVIKFYAVDRVGNVGKPQEIAFSIDRQAPLTEVSIQGDFLENILSPRATISLKSNDATAGLDKIYYSFDKQATQVYTRPFSLLTFKEEQHSLQFFGKDRLQNAEEAKDFNFVVDRTPPVVTPAIEGEQHQNRNRIFVSGRSKIRLDVEDNMAGVEKVFYSMDGQGEKLYEEPFSLNKNQGVHKISYRAIDKVKNEIRSKLDDRYSLVFLDLGAPKIGYTLKGAQFESRDTIFIQSSTLVQINAEDAESGLQKVAYQINGNPEVPYENTPFSIAEGGRKKMRLYAIDNVNNEVSKELAVVVDNEAPIIHLHWSMNPYGTKDDAQKGLISVYSPQTMLYLAATDALVGTQQIFVSLNGSPDQPYATPLRNFKKGLNQLRISAIDILGNKTPPQEINFWIE